MADLIELSKSNRASCRICKDKIPKGVPRFGKETIFRGSDGKEHPSYKWFHWECAMKKYPKNLIKAELKIELSDTYKIEYIKLKDELSTSAFALKSIDKFTDPNRRVSLITSSLRGSRPKVIQNLNGEEEMCLSIFIVNDEYRSKLFLWGKHHSLPVKKGDQIVVIDALTDMAENDKIQFHATDASVVLLNPTEDEIKAHSKSIEIFEAVSWERPYNSIVEFTYAKTSRAKCRICEEKIEKSTLKVIKPVLREDEKTDRKFSSALSMHVLCAIQDLNADDLLHEAVSRLTPELVAENKTVLTKLMNILPDGEVKNILNQVL